MKRTVLFLMVALTLAGCGGKDSREALGLEAGPPDAFLVTRRAPLEMPPDYALRPPTPGAPRPQEAPTVDAAAAAALGHAPARAQNASAGEAALLRAAGAQGTAPDIRDQVNAETAAKRQDSRATIDKMLGTTLGGDPTMDEALDPVEEIERTREDTEPL
jgi:hypothetical protein